MANGFALGGAARGLESALADDVRRKGLVLQEKELAQRGSLAERGLDIQERRLKQNERNKLMTEVDKVIGEELKIVSEVINASKEAGHTPEQISATIEPLLADIDDLSSKVGKDSKRIRNQVGALLQTPTMSDPKEEKTRLQIGELESEAAGRRASAERRALAAISAKNSLEFLKTVPGAKALLLTPSLVPATRRAIELGKRDPTGVLKGLPSALAGVPEDQLLEALDAVERIGKQRNVLVQGLQTSNRAGAAGLASQLQAQAEGAGLEVQMERFDEALQDELRRAELEGSPIDLNQLSGIEQEDLTANPKERVFDSQESFETGLRSGDVNAGDTVNIGNDQPRRFAGRFVTRGQVDEAFQAGRVKKGDLVQIGDFFFVIPGGR